MEVCVRYFGQAYNFSLYVEVTVNFKELELLLLFFGHIFVQNE